MKYFQNDTFIRRRAFDLLKKCYSIFHFLKKKITIDQLVLYRNTENFISHLIATLCKFVPKLKMWARRLLFNLENRTVF